MNCAQSAVAMVEVGTVYSVSYGRMMNYLQCSKACDKAMAEQWITSSVVKLQQNNELVTEW